MIKKYIALSVLAASAALAGCSSDDDDPPPVVAPPPADPTNGSSAYDVVANSADHTTLAALLITADLADTLDDPAAPGGYTIFAPNDAAFVAFEEENPGVLDGLTPEQLSNALQYHVVGGTVTSTQVAEGVTNATEENPFTAPSLVPDALLTFTNPEGGLSVNDVVIATADLEPESEGATGIVHVIGTVLTIPTDGGPPPADTTNGSSAYDVVANSADHTTLAALLITADLADTLDDPAAPGGYTIFAPTDAAFDAFEEENPGVLAGLTPEQLSNALQYHVVSGTVNSTQVAEGVAAATEENPFTAPSLVADALLTFTNPEGGLSVNDVVIATPDLEPEGEGATGIVHVIGTVLAIPADGGPPAADSTNGSSAYDVVANSTDHTTLAALLITADLADTLDDPAAPGGYTIFAPTDAAFDAFEEENPGVLAGLTPEQLSNTLQYHVVSGTVNSTQVAEGVTNATEENPFTAPSLVPDALLTFTNPEGGLSVNDVVIATADLEPESEGATGIVHVIGTVLTIPEASTTE